MSAGISATDKGGATTPLQPQEEMLAVRNVVKRYGPVTALSGVSLSLRKAEVLALIGDNGAGKSTLVSIIAGLSKPDSGEVLVAGKTFTSTPHAARAAGIETVFQNLMLVPTLDIAQNVFLGRELFQGGPVGRLMRNVNNRRMRREVEEAFASLGLNLPPVTAKAGALSGGQRQAVAIARAVIWGSKIVVMDEPLAALGVQQTEAVLGLVEGLRDHGIATLLVTHNMQHVLRVASRVAVLRLGQKVADVDLAEHRLGGMQLVGLITGELTQDEL
jgi:ABC-type sugar transport system ATPase subunit